MDKPISMVIKETKSNLIQVCNESNLHISILQLIVKEMHDELNKVAQRVMEEEELQYSNSIKEKDCVEEGQ